MISASFFLPITMPVIESFSGGCGTASYDYILWDLSPRAARRLEPPLSYSILLFFLIWSPYAEGYDGGCGTASCDYILWDLSPRAARRLEPPLSYSILLFFLDLVTTC
ncbi:MAG: hypothetical protein GY915_03555 [bacterium]|nr:hypothetical protein [bacterium]